MSRSIAPLLVLVALGVADVGCIYRSKVDGRSFKLPERFAAAKKAKQGAKRARAWWTVFSDATLDRLMARAFSQNLSLAQARARVRQARAQLMSARGGWLPTIGGSGQLGRSKRILGGSLPSIETNTVQLSLQASYEFDLWGKTRYAYKSAKQGIRAAEQELRAAYISLAAQLAEAYYLAVSARAQLTLLEHTIDNRTRQLELVKRRYGEGVVSAVDLYQSLGALAQARATKPAFEQQLAQAGHNVALLLGRYPGQVHGGKLDKLPEKVRTLPAASPKGLLLQRPDLRAAHHRLLATDAQVGVALAGHFPSLSFSAEIGKSFDPSGIFWSLLGSLTAPLFQGGRTHAEYKRRKAVLAEQIAGFKDTLLRAVKEVEDALVAGRAQEARVEHLAESARVAEGALRLATEQYAQGLTGYLNVLTSEQSVYTARSALIGARRELISARIQLARALGGSWMDKEIERQAQAKQKQAR